MNSHQSQREERKNRKGRQRWTEELHKSIHYFSFLLSAGAISDGKPSSVVDEQFNLIYLTQLVVITSQSNQLPSLLIKDDVSQLIRVFIRMKHLDDVHLWMCLVCTQRPKCSYPLKLMTDVAFYHKRISNIICCQPQIIYASQLKGTQFY